MKEHGFFIFLFHKHVSEVGIFLLLGLSKGQVNFFSFFPPGPSQLYNEPFFLFPFDGLEVLDRLAKVSCSKLLAF